LLMSFMRHQLYDKIYRINDSSGYEGDCCICNRHVDKEYSLGGKEYIRILIMCRYDGKIFMASNAVVSLCLLSEGSSKLKTSPLHTTHISWKVMLLNLIAHLKGSS
jgi:hypothetical protein